MKKILNYKEFYESKSIQDVEKHPEEENIKITEIRPDDIVAGNRTGETVILSKEEVIEK